MVDGGNSVPRITKAEHIGPDDTGDNIQAKRVAGYVWDGSNWQRTSQNLTNTELRATAVPVAAMKYAHTMLIDVVSATVTYIGEAEPGTATTALAWRIKKITVTGSLTEIQWADGVGTFTKVYNDRATYTYS